VSATLDRLVDRFAGLRVLVVGEAMLDGYLYGVTERLCREAPVPIVDVARRVLAPGGAANAAVNARSLGAEVTLLSVVGADDEGATLRRVLADHGVAGTALVEDPSRRTLVKQRLVADGHMLVRIDQGSTGALPAASERALRGGLTDLACGHDAIVVSD
jgi:D-beta-D-heptose 7-phosphate kinase/D-beta-D-heptose 1-phosphate adenosyltransferase